MKEPLINAIILLRWRIEFSLQPNIQLSRDQSVKSSLSVLVQEKKKRALSCFADFQQNTRILKISQGMSLRARGLKIWNLALHMRRFPEPQHFFAAAWQNWDLRSSKECPRKMLYKQMFTYFQNIGFVATGFEASKFLRKCEPPLWSIINCRKLAIYNWPLRDSTVTKDWILQIFVLQNNNFENMQEMVWIKIVKAPLWRIVNLKLVIAAAKKCCSSGNYLICLDMVHIFKPNFCIENVSLFFWEEKSFIEGSVKFKGHFWAPWWQFLILQAVSKCPKRRYAGMSTANGFQRTRPLKFIRTKYVISRRKGAKRS